MTNFVTVTRLCGKLLDLLTIFNPRRDKNDSIAENAKESFTLGQTVQLTDGSVRTIRFIGPVHFGKKR